ncbi:MAG: hypothetical protein J3R72DRAFT_430500 [Linnemannia gamsii]|nr:MAG: hypothetical protein J3R72DRAFT_430500 [Linnemannia gamsii]
MTLITAEVAWVSAATAAAIAVVAVAVAVAVVESSANGGDDAVESTAGGRALVPMAHPHPHRLHHLPPPPSWHRSKV